MAIELFFSNQIEVLAENLSADLSSELSEKKDKFYQMVVIVPNQNMAKWLQLTLARLKGILLLVRFDFMENGLWNQVAELDRDRNFSRLMDHKIRTFKLVQCLNTLDLNIPELAPISDYLLDSLGNKRIDFAPRLWQLAQRLSVLFQEYEHQRAAMIHSWLSGKRTDTAMERCQQYLYKRLCEASVFISLLNYSKKILDHPKIPFENSDPCTIHIFGLSQISGFYLNLLNRLAALHSIKIYTLNPSREFWEDVQTPAERHWLGKKQVRSQTQLEDESAKDSAGLFVQDHPLLALWGKPGRENIRQLCALTDYSFYERYCQPENQNTVLHKIQGDLLTLRSKTYQRIDQDRSLQIFASPSRFREVETVYNTICHNLKADKTLKLTDVAILVPDMNLYKPVFDAVFNRTPRILSYNLVDSNAHSESLYGQAILEIIELAQGNFTRRAVFNLLLNPCFMQYWDIGIDEIRDWVEWADELNIFHSFSRKDLQSNVFPVKERFSWKQALQRLRLGRIMASPDGTILDVRDFYDMIPFANLASSNQEILEKFCMVIEALYSKIQKLSQFRGSCQQWTQLFALVCDSLIRVPDNNRGEVAVQQALFYGMEDLNAIFSHQKDSDHDIWDIELFKEYILFLLKGISGGRGDYLTDGVTISAFAPMRPIPFKIMFALGMEEGQFPGREVISALDLRQQDRRREDISLPERNCYLFLEMLLSVRKKLYLGYIARDLQKDRGISPCSVINQLKDYVESAILSDSKEFKITSIPLKGNDLRYLDPHRFTPWSDVLSNFALIDRVSLFRTHNLWADFLNQALPEDIDRIQPLTPILNTTATLNQDNDLRKQMVTTRKLARFLMDPVKQSAQSHLGLYGKKASIEDLAVKEDEPFYSIFPMDYNIQLDCLRVWLAQGFNEKLMRLPSDRDIKTILTKIYTGYAKKSAAPDGVYGRLDCQTILEKTLATVKTVRTVLDQFHPHKAQYGAVYWGTAEERHPDYFKTTPVLRLPPLEMVLSAVGYQGDQQQLIAEIHAALHWIWQDKDEMWHTLVLTGSKNGGPRPNRHLLAPLLAYLVLSSHHPSDTGMDGVGMHFHLIYETKIQSFVSALSPSEATVHLKNLMEAFYNQKDFHWLPFETVLKCETNPVLIKKERFSDDHRQDFCDEMAGYFDEVDDYIVRRLAAPISPYLFDMAEKRFRWIFNVVSK